MSEVIPFPKTDRPENVEALELMKETVRAHMAAGFDREKFIECAGLVWECIVVLNEVDGE